MRVDVHREYWCVGSCKTNRYNAQPCRPFRTFSIEGVVLLQVCGTAGRSCSKFETSDHICMGCMLYCCCCIWLRDGRHCKRRSTRSVKHASIWRCCARYARPGIVRPIPARLTSVADPGGLIDDHAVCFGCLDRRTCPTRQPASLVLITSGWHRISLQPCHCFAGWMQHRTRPTGIVGHHEEDLGTRDRDLACWHTLKEAAEAQQLCSTTGASTTALTEPAAYVLSRRTALLANSPLHAQSANIARCQVNIGVDGALWASLGEACLPAALLSACLCKPTLRRCVGQIPSCWREFWRWGLLHCLRSASVCYSRQMVSIDVCLDAGTSSNPQTLLVGGAGSHTRKVGDREMQLGVLYSASKLMVCTHPRSRSAQQICCPLPPRRTLECQVRHSQGARGPPPAFGPAAVNYRSMQVVGIAAANARPPGKPEAGRHIAQPSSQSTCSILITQAPHLRGSTPSALAHIAGVPPPWAAPLASRHASTACKAEYCGW